MITLFKNSHGFLAGGNDEAVYCFTPQEALKFQDRAEAAAYLLDRGWNIDGWTLEPLDFTVFLAEFVAGAQTIISEYFAEHYSRLSPPTLHIDPNGRKYIRIVRRDSGATGGSVHCFIDTTNGNVLKAASWKAPAKHARGNIYDVKNGLGLMGPHGPAYLR